LYLAGKRSLLIIPKNYWQFNVVQPFPALINKVNSSISVNFAKELAFESVMFVSQLTFEAGEWDLVQAKLSDGTKVEQQLLFINGNWVNLGMRLLQMGTGTAPPSNKS
jgi:hypothetical protein